MGGGSEVSGELRFSVEDLLYYAPRFTGVGQSLSSAVDAAEKRLLGLGSFWGGSWPDEAFAHRYPPAQYALLILVKKIATDLQGIGGGIELMAKDYGITEADIQENIERIGEAAAQESALLNHTGGLPVPPDVPIAAGGTPFTPVPHPAPESPPSPPRAPLSSATPPPRRPGNITPSPSPGTPAGPRAWRTVNARQWLGPWPSGKPDKMDEAAAIWHGLAESLRTAWADTQRYLAYVLSDNEGRAARALEATVQGLIDGNDGSLTHALQASEELEGACSTQATGIRNLKYQVENLLAQFAAMFAIDLAFAWVTFGTSVAAEAALAEGLETALNRLITLFIDETAKLSETIATAVERISDVIAKSTISGALGLSKSGAAVPLGNLISEALEKKDTKSTSPTEQILQNGGIYALEGAFTGTAATLSTTLRDLGEKGGPATTRLLMLSRQLKSESISVEAASQALQSMVKDGTITPSSYASAVISGRLKTALAPHPGKHVRH